MQVHTTADLISLKASNYKTICHACVYPIRKGCKLPALLVTHQCFLVPDVTVRKSLWINPIACAWLFILLVAIASCIVCEPSRHSSPKCAELSIAVAFRQRFETAVPRLRSRSTLLRCAAGVALCVALQTALSFVAPASGAAKAGCTTDSLVLVVVRLSECGTCEALDTATGFMYGLSHYDLGGSNEAACRRFTIESADAAKQCGQRGTCNHMYIFKDQGLRVTPKLQ